MAREFNEAAQPESIPESQDAEKAYWTDVKSSPGQAFVGNEVRSFHIL